MRRAALQGLLFVVRHGWLEDPLDADAPDFLLSRAACSLAMMVLGAGFGLALAALGGINPGTAVLATSPGGIAEMSLTARVLHLGAPIVTAVHVSRMVAMVLLIGPRYRLAVEQPRLASTCRLRRLTRRGALPRLAA